MPTLDEQPVFHEGIHQVSKTDSVVGGTPDAATRVGGPNIAAQQLADRTRWLHEKIGEILAQLDANQILALLRTVDGQGSGLDADFLDGINSTRFQRPPITLPSGHALVHEEHWNTLHDTAVAWVYERYAGSSPHGSGDGILLNLLGPNFNDNERAQLHISQGGASWRVRRDTGWQPWVSIWGSAEQTEPPFSRSDETEFFAFSPGSNIRIYPSFSGKARLVMARLRCIGNDASFLTGDELQVPIGEANSGTHVRVYENDSYSIRFTDSADGFRVIGRNGDVVSLNMSRWRMKVIAWR